MGAAALANVITGADILASMEVTRAALEKLACLGNGSVPGNSVGNEIAKAALVEAGAELDGDQLTNDTIALSFCAHGASTTVTIGDMRKLGAAIKGAVAHK